MWRTSHKHNIVLNGMTMTSSIKLLLLLLQPFYGPLDFVCDYPGKPVTER